MFDFILAEDYSDEYDDDDDGYGIWQLGFDTTPNKPVSNHRFRDLSKPDDKEDWVLTGARDSILPLAPDTVPNKKNVSEHVFRDTTVWRSVISC